MVSFRCTVDGVVFSDNDRLLAVVDSASTSTYAGNWHKLDYTDSVLSVAGATGAVSAADILSGLLAVDGTGSGLAADTVDGVEGADLVARASHTGTQTASTISDFDSSVAAAASVTAKTAKISYTDAALAASNTSDIATNAGGVSTNATTVFNLGTDVAGHHTRLATIESDITGIGTAQGVQDTAIALNTAKVSYDDTEAAAATAAISTLQSEQTVQDTAIALNTAKVSYPDAALVATHTTDIDALQLGTGIPATERTGINRTLVLSEANHTVMFSNAGRTTVTIPLNSAVAFPTGTSVALHSTGAGGLTLSTTGITINGSSPNTTIAQNEIMVIEKTATDTWSVYGGTAA